MCKVIIDTKVLQTPYGTWLSNNVSLPLLQFSLVDICPFHSFPGCPLTYQCLRFLLQDLLLALLVQQTEWRHSLSFHFFLGKKSVSLSYLRDCFAEYNALGWFLQFFAVEINSGASLSWPVKFLLRGVVMWTWLPKCSFFSVETLKHFSLSFIHDLTELNLTADLDHPLLIFVTFCVFCYHFLGNAF